MSLINTDCNRYIFVKKLLVFFINIFFHQHFMIWFIALDVSPNATQLTWFCWKMSLVRHIESLPSNHMQLESFRQTRLHLIYFVLLCIYAFCAVSLIHKIHWVAVTMCIMLAAINCVFSSLNDPNTSYGEKDEKMNKIYFYPFFYAFQFIGLRCAHGLQWHCKYSIHTMQGNIQLCLGLIYI